MAKPKNVDEYIASQEGTFAHPIMERVREITHETAPQVEEKIKWGTPSFEYKGLMMSLVAFKKHVAVWFHKGALLDDPENLLEASSDETKSMRKYHIHSIEELNEAALKGLIKEAVKANEEGKQVEGMRTAKDETVRSEMLDMALKQNPKAAENYDSLTEYKKKEYAQHIESAKQQKTKQRRLEKSLDLLEQGLGLNDKYR